MKKIILAFFIGTFCIISCQKEPSYKIIGKVNDIANGDSILLQEYKNGEMKEIETTTVKDGGFTFKGHQDSTVVRYITYIKGNKKFFVDFFLSNNEIHIDLGPNSRVYGTNDNDIYQEFKDSFISVNNSINSLYMKLKMDTTLTDIDKTSLENKIQTKDSLGMVMVFKTINNNLKNPVGIYLLPNYAEAFSLEQQKTLLQKVPAKYSKLPFIIKIKENIKNKEKVTIGEKYIDFSMRTIDDNSVKLSEYISNKKYTLIDFWASWCSPCISEMPNLIEAYKKYNSKGFEIVGVSLDNNKNSWKETVEKLELKWPQLSDLKGWNNSAAKLYSVSSIPSSFLINQEGLIIAKNLRGESLIMKLNELYEDKDDL